MAGAYTYILTNERQTVLYTGSTDDLAKRIHHHKHRLIPGFTRKYNAYRLVYFETLTDMNAARRREGEIKGMTRRKKEALINSVNKSWQDLSPG